MTANDVNVVIDNIASKLGLAASGMADFVPELARYAIAQDIIAAVISAVVLLVAVLAVRWSIKNPPKDSLDWELPSPFARWFGTIGGIIALIVFMVCVSDLAGWLASPAAAAVKSVLSAMGT